MQTITEVIWKAKMKKNKRRFQKLMKQRIIEKERRETISKLVSEQLKDPLRDPTSLGVLSELETHTNLSFQKPLETKFRKKGKQLR